MLLEVTTGGYMLPLVIRYYHWLLLLPLVAYHYCNFCCHWFVVLCAHWVWVPLFQMGFQEFWGPSIVAIALGRSCF